MSGVKPYKKQNPESQSVQEIAARYESPACCSAEDFVVFIPEELMNRTIDSAIEDCRAGKGISHEQMDSFVKTEMGWK